jgi:NAD(P)-dependent dehydrogenase (short-subunit alcohol dehydrogenase family)
VAPADPGRRGCSTGAVTERANCRAVLVTGSSRAIGRAIAHALAAGGDRVAVHSGSSRQVAERVAASHLRS